MREILFRGKTPDGRWVCGDLVNYDNGKKTIVNNKDESLVINKTIGQYTGMKDKNGKMVFEGDIFRSVHFESRDGMHYLNHIVEWSDRLFGWYMKNAHPCAKDGHLQMWIYFNNAISPEVIGNIHDNPDLIK